MTPPRGATLPEVLLHWADTRPEQRLFYFVDLESRLSSLAAAELVTRARHFGAALRRRGVGPGDRVLLAYDSGPELIIAFFGCSLLEAVPCIVELPPTPAAAPAWAERLLRKMRLVGSSALVIDDGFRELVERSLAAKRASVPEHPASVHVWGTAELLAEHEELPIPRPRPESLAFIQFTSGTTLLPRGVQVSQQAVIENVRRLAEVGAWSTNDLMLGWLPLYHDMGLVATTMAAFAHGLPTALMPPMSFVLSPARWLWAIHYFRGTLSFAPNFAYQLCSRRLRDPELEGLDLSSWRRAYNAAEFIHADTVHQFAERFRRHGFALEATIPGYGMAEMVVGVATRAPDEPLTFDTISRSALAAEGRAVPLAPGAPDALTLLGVGRPFPGSAARIVDEAGRVLGDRAQGEILLRGPSLFSGYVNDPAGTDAVLHDGWLRTGDLGYTVDGQLFICGRNKDLIIKAGENHHPYLMEDAAARVPGVRPGRVAAVGVPNPRSGTEDLVVVFETGETEAEAVRRLSQQVADQILREAGLRPDRVLAVPPGTLSKTSSGKLRRRLLREQILNGQLPGNTGQASAGASASH